MPQLPNISIHVVGPAAATAAKRLRAGSAVLIQGRVERAAANAPLLVRADRIDGADLYTVEPEPEQAELESAA